MAGIVTVHNILFTHSVYYHNKRLAMLSYVLIFMAFYTYFCIQPQCETFHSTDVVHTIWHFLIVVSSLCMFLAAF
jgi:predicted membrane channel-forming protein YqfA (hemolysin III family)